MREICDCKPNRYTIKIFCYTGKVFEGESKTPNIKMGDSYMHRYFVDCVACHNTLVTYRFFIKDPSKYEIGF
jgi:hypothetical protein